MENKKGNSILLTVIGVATLLVALVGATFAYFTATDTSDAQNVDTGKLEITTTFTDGGQENIIPTYFNTTDTTDKPAVDEVIADMSVLNGNANIAKFDLTVDGGETDVRGAQYDITLVGAVIPYSEDSSATGETELSNANNGVANQGGDKSDVKYVLVDTTDGANTIVATGDLVSGGKIYTRTSFTGETADSYSLYVYIEESTRNQDKLQGATVTAQMIATAYTPKIATQG